MASSSSTSSSSSSLSDPFTSYSLTHRIVLLIDIDPLLHHPNPTTSTYTTTLLSSFKTLFSFPSLSSSLFSFSLFFSSLSPLLSSSLLPLPSPFDLPLPTLHLLSRSLLSLNFISPPISISTPKASHLATSLRHIFHHYLWDPPIPDDDNDNNNPNPPIKIVPSNLVLLFSPLSNSFDSLSSFFDGEIGRESLREADSFCERFSRGFDCVRRVFDSKDIHCCFIGVRSGSGYGNENDDDEVSKVHGLFEIGARKLGWGFCSLDSIVLGSAIVPFGLIYPKIAISRDSIQFDDDGCSRNVQVQLNLQILDVNANPIGYNCCDLELVDFRIIGRLYQGDVRFNPESSNLRSGGFERKERFWKLCLDGISKFEVKAVHKCDAFVNLRGRLSESILVREVFRESKKKHEGSSDEFYANRVLQMLAVEFGSRWRRKPAPFWEILLSFLYKEGLWALVSLTYANGGSCTGILRPFTVNSALLSILGDPDMACDSEVCKTDHKLKKNKGLLDSQAKKMMDLKVLKSLTWSSFCDSAYDQYEMDLHEVYYAMECNKSRKLLKFLKCWMKQMKKSGCSDSSLPEKVNPNQLITEEINDRLTELPQNDVQPITPSSSVGINTEASRIQDEAVLDFRSESSEAFFSNLSNKIQQGIESEVVDLGALAERLVNSSVYWLYQKVDKETVSEGCSPSNVHKASGSILASEVIKLLLREPKELAAKHKGRNSFSQASGPGPNALIPEHIVREYELQILFRMEILQSDIGSGVEDSSKQKFVKQICLLLESIQCHMEGGFFGNWNLENYASRIIKSRYSDTLEDVVHKIYNKLDLLLFADEDEAPDSLLNSEDSNKSLNRKVFRDEMGENNEPVSAEDEPFQLQKNNSGRLKKIIPEDHAQKLIDAKARRERARRFSSFTSWMPDLHRVWAPKQKGVKIKTDPLRKPPKRKERQRAHYDTVVETPMAGNKRSSPWTRGSDDDSGGSQICGSVSKALFQDDDV